MSSWEKSLDDLTAGNERFMSGELKAKRSDAEIRKQLYEQGQKPIAVIVCTSDAYMPPELVFDAELGELYVIRTPDLSVDREVIDGIEYAVKKLGVPLCMVVTHEDRPGDPEEDEGFSFFRRRNEDTHALIQAAVDKIRSSSALESYFETGAFFAVGATYDLETGAITVFNY
ncbi:MAG: Carbonic anhydrase 2 [Firmicutes bacterium ADurb.Bin182]|nr:MAG: Carbonic anhydrase 2 [Firmicutes bacterium ADurb.Bin182]